MNKIALIPSLEPDEKLIKLVKELKINNYDVVVVDDGSGEEYKKIFDKLDAKVISYSKNHGKGYALKTGLKYIQENYPESVVVTMDSDGQHKVKDANNLYNYVKNHRDELAIGSRIRNNKTPMRSKIGNSITMFIFKITTGLKIYDTQTGLRSFSSLLIPHFLDIKGDRYEYEMNMLLNLNKYKIKCKEIPIETIYFNNNKASHFNTIKDSFLIYKEIAKYKTKKD